MTVIKRRKSDGTDEIVSAVVVIPGATAGSQGGVQLTGDLGGSASSPTVPGLASKAIALTTTSVKTAAYTAGANEIVPADASSAPVTITFPNAPADKTRLTVKKIDSSTNAVTLNLAGVDVFNKAGGVTTGTLSLTNQAISVQYSTTGNIWTVTGDDLPLSQLDARYTTLAAVAATYSPLASPALTGTPTINGTAVATTADVAAGAPPKAAVRVAATSNITLTSPGTTIDSVTLSNGDRVLLVAQTTSTENGIYVFNGSGSALTRSTDANTASNLGGAYVFVTAGATQAGSGWKLATTGTVTPDVTPQTWALFAVAPAASLTTSVQVDTFTTSGTWTKPSGAKTVRVFLIAGGGGGGAGATTASGTACSGGGAGGGGGLSMREIPATLVGSTETVTVGSGGSGGAAITASSTAGSDGTAGSQSAFGTHVRASGGGLGAGGKIGAGASAGTNGAGTTPGSSGGAGANGAVGGIGASAGGGGGGGGAGGGISTTPAFFAGGAGGLSFSDVLAAGIAGTTAGASGGTGVGAAAGIPSPGAGGGGGAAAISGTAGSGGAAGNYGGGGGGGGAAVNTGTSGAGGAGGAGIVIVYTQF